MKNKNLTKIFWSFGLACAIIGIVFAGMMVGVADENGAQSLSKNAYTPHAPIYINGNSDFTFENGVTGGNGTESNPYIIEGWEIDIDSVGEAGVKGIQVKNTNAYFIIRNCKIYNGGTHPNEGILFDQVINGKIENCEIYNTTNGIWFLYSSNGTIINSSISCFDFTDIALSDSSHLIALNTTFDKNRISFKDEKSTLTVGWYLHVKVIDSTGSPISGATVRVQDNANGIFDQNYTTGHDGWVRWIECTEYWQNQTTKIYYTPHNVTASKTGYETNYSDVNMYNSKEITITLSTSVGLTPHDPISINGNAQFTSANGVVSGSGTQSDPYIIENWDINANTAKGIEIRNTNVYFIIRNCVIHDGKSNNKYGIYFYNVTNGKIDGVTSYNNYYGIRLFSSSNNNTITNCNVYNNYVGIELYSSSNNKLRNNTLNNNTSNFGVYGDILHYYQDIDTSNTINGKPIYYVMNQNGLVFNNTMNIGYLGLVSCSNIKVENLTFINNLQGLLLADTSYSTITNCAVYNNSWDGIWLRSSSNNNITNCSVYNNSCGIELWDSPNNQITNCAVYNNSYYGIWLSSSSNNNQITNCDVYNNSWCGIWFASSNNNVISACYVYDNDY